MSPSLPHWATPKWTATRSDLNWPRTYVFLGLVVSFAGYVAYALPYVTTDTPIPSTVANGMFLLYFAAIPVFALWGSTEVLYDGTHVALRAIFVGAGLFLFAYWTTEGVRSGVSAFASGQLRVAFSFVVTALYATVVFGMMWIIQYARQGTSGVETDLP